MTTDSARTPWTVQGLLDLFDVQQDAQNRFLAATGPSGDDERQVVEGSQVLAQAIVAAAKRFPEKSVRSVSAVFAGAVLVGAGPVEPEIDVVSDGRSTLTAVVAAKQNPRRCITMTVLADVPTSDVIRHHLPRPDVAPPADANVSVMPMTGRQLRLVDVVDVNSPDESGRRSCTPGCTTIRSRLVTTWRRRWSRISLATLVFRRPCAHMRVSEPRRRISRCRPRQ